MSKIDAQSLFKSAQKGAEDQEKYKQRKQARIQQCIEKFNGTCDELNKKYFDPTNKFSINQSLDRACRQTQDSSTVKLYMNFDRDDFVIGIVLFPLRQMNLVETTMLDQLRVLLCTLLVLKTRVGCLKISLLMSGATRNLQLSLQLSLSIKLVMSTML